SASGNQASITVNALHVTAFDPVTGQTLADVVISSSHADISCGACTPPVGDFVTGGGWITGTPSGSRANFGVAGGIKNGGLWGHLTYIDHGPNGFKVKGTGVTSYEVTGPTSRRIKGTAEVDGVGGYTYIVDVTDNGEPGRNDTFAITLSNTYSASGFLAGGNIKLHGEPSPCL
ncbi:MAG TPA: post-COAP-1 domain-containing protein, partial [Gemmatimonadales bacterium]|nr:post-COAP-1 domain-containing protein [Gemmatimonadales bacterium]